LGTHRGAEILGSFQNLVNQCWADVALAYWTFLIIGMKTVTVTVNVVTQLHNNSFLVPILHPGFGNHFDNPESALSRQADVHSSRSETTWSHPQ
jgi:hypothetical protein